MLRSALHQVFDESEGIEAELDGGHEHAAFVPEPAVDERRIDTGTPGDPADRRPVETLFREHLLRSGKHLPARVRVATPASGAARRIGVGVHGTTVAPRRRGPVLRSGCGPITPSSRVATFSAAARDAGWYGATGVVSLDLLTSSPPRNREETLVD